MATAPAAGHQPDHHEDDPEQNAVHDQRSDPPAHDLRAVNRRAPSSARLRPVERTHPSLPASSATVASGIPSPNAKTTPDRHRAAACSVPRVRRALLCLLLLLVAGAAGAPAAHAEVKWLC